jgi:hypothetical protein
MTTPSPAARVRLAQAPMGPPPHAGGCEVCINLFPPDLRRRDVDALTPGDLLRLAAELREACP